MSIRSLILVAALFCMTAAQADVSRPGDTEAQSLAPNAWAFKLTPSYYSTSHQQAATDINLRANYGQHAFWLGYYQQPGQFEQSRTGYELTLDGQYGKVIPSLQLASGGFAGSSINIEAGTSLYALFGYGRTNARDYYNLNFDPNDAVTLGIGSRLIPNTSLLLYRVRDNRLHTGQVVNHLVARIEHADHQRVTVDVSEKHGRATPDDLKVSGYGLSVTYDYHEVFVRVARDNKVNFSSDNQNRVSLGMRF